jgi:hypothetical protein
MIHTKREHLEQFICEQVIGPGISGYRFINLQEEEILSKNLDDLKPLDYSKELINIVPAGVYSTGILFPVDKSKLNNDNGLTNRYDKEILIEDDGNNTIEKEQDEDSIEDEGAIYIDQMFPNTMGITCCFNNDFQNFKKATIKLKARYYTKIDHKIPNFNQDYGVLCECDSASLRSLIANTILEHKVQVVERGVNKIVLFNQSSVEQLAEIKALLRNISEIKTEALKNKLTEFDFSLKARSLSALKQSCYYELKNQSIQNDKRSILYDVSQEIEEVENIISHINDLVELNDSRSYGLWQCNPIEIDVPLPENISVDLVGKRTFTYKTHKSLKNIFKYDLLNGKYAALSMNFQISKDSRRGDGKIFLKAQLINTSTPFEKQEGDSRYYSTFNEEVNVRTFFGVSLSITDENLVPYNSLELRARKDNYGEDDVTKFIYRQFKDYGIGHGCSVKWTNNGDGTVTVGTEYIPVCDTPDIDPTPRNKEKFTQTTQGFEPSLFIESSKALEFKWLSHYSGISNNEVLNGLNQFVNSYGLWIEFKSKKYQTANDQIKTIAFQELNKCQSDKERMTNNISLFLAGEKNVPNLESFRLMNAAMFMQLWHSVKAKGNEVQNILADAEFKSFDEDFYQKASDQLFQNGVAVAWRPFQLAFILLNLDGIFKEKDDAKWDKRNEWVDLVWFPTGGGKTEAYLGIIALTIINRRRLFKEQGGGTAAIMRYTLRLLTLQQFQRATLVIMALELLRRWELYNLGKEPIFIGLWVGDNSLPNKMLPSANKPDDKNNLLSEFLKLSDGKKSKIPYDNCPWCRSKLSPSNQEISDKGNVFHYNRLHLKCSHPKCSFSLLRPARARPDQGPIPVSLCDEEIYQHPPALLFGTVDKFAQLAHKVSDEEDKRNKDSRRLFGKGNWESGKPRNGYLPPDLIIQDELHLLLGPLGSSVALFESAIDQLCKREDGTRPKIISSTATTRNTDLQIMALFDRKVNLFPKPGVECDDSFFSFYRRKFKDIEGNGQEYLSKRRYIGILPTGRTQIWMQMRLAAILMTHRAIFEMSQLKEKAPLEFDSYKNFEKAMDYYHTIVSYFNSLKEVGKTESQIHTYILKEIRRVFNRVIRPNKLMHALYTYSIRKGELTGRLSGEEVKNELEKVQSKWSAAKRFAYQSNEDVQVGHTPPDFVVATNMISVGIDVSRFNTIIMNSMPRNIAEYIQASSRVARDSYGLVLTVHHPFRARDISHYEKFIEFHEKMYSYVEPISITPFTQKAIERYLGLYLATIIRHRTEFVNRDSAREISHLNSEQFVELIDETSKYFEERRIHLSESTVNDLVKNLLKKQNVDIIKKWIEDAINEWRTFENISFADGKKLVFNNKKANARPPQEQLYVDIDEYEGNIHSEKWQVPMSLRVIEPEAVLKIKLK